MQREPELDLEDRSIQIKTISASLDSQVSSGKQQQGKDFLRPVALLVGQTHGDSSAYIIALCTRFGASRPEADTAFLSLYLQVCLIPMAFHFDDNQHLRIGV